MTSHSHYNPPDPEQERMFAKLVDELTGNAPRQWPRGRLSGDDDGQTHVAFAVDPDSKIIRIQFTRPMVWLGLGAQEARAMAKTLKEKATELESL